MELIELGRAKKGEEKELDPALVKAILSRAPRSPFIVKRAELLGEEVLSGSMPRSLWAGATVKSMGVKGLEFADELSEVKRQVDDLNSQVESVKSELQQCKEGISTILNELREKPIIKQTELFEMDETLEVIRPIPVVIEEYDDEVIATFPEIEAFGVGLCEAEAIIDLKSEIRKIFFELEELGDKELGKLPLSWKRVLSKVVKKIGNVQ